MILLGSCFLIKKFSDLVFIKYKTSIDKMDKLRPNKFILRFAVIILIHLIVVIGDQSMDVWELSTRRFINAVLFVGFWLPVWFFASYISLAIHKKQTLSKGNKSVYGYLLFTFNFVFGFFAGVGYNLVFRFTDIYFFQMDEPWSHVPLFNPELSMSLFSIYMMVFTADVFFTSTLKRKEDQLQMEKLKQETTLAQYLLLKSRIEPHFLFNSLSVLSSIIHTDINLAEEFILRLSKTLRYVIEKNELPLVPLHEEICFVDDYFFLIKNRFDEGIIFENSIDKSITQNSYIPPASLQLLIENAVKHNKFTTDEPLRINLFTDGGQIVVTNNINLRDDITDSTNQGLQNLTQRYLYFSDKPVNITIKENDFTVTMPILTKTDYERINS